MTPFQQVIEFNREVLRIAPPPLRVLPKHQAEILVKQLREEITEFEEAHTEDNLVGCIDALIDLVYFAFGGLYKKGVNDEDFHNVFTIVHTQNMLKKKGVVEKRKVLGAEDAIKPENWLSPERLIAEYFSGDLND